MKDDQIELQRIYLLYNFGSEKNEIRYFHRGSNET